MTLRFKATPPELITASIFRGMYTEIARKLGVSPQHVRHVALGKTTSQRVLREILRECRRRLAKVERAA